MTSWLSKAAILGVRTAARVLPVPVTRAIYRRCLGELGLGLCLHRVIEVRRPKESVPEVTAAADGIDEFLDIVAPGGTPVHGGPLTLTFDDGYADAVRYVATRAASYAGVRWLLFVCPEKTQRQCGFRWDLYEILAGRREVSASLQDFILDDLDAAAENRRDDLRAVAARPEFRLATVQECQRVTGLPNVGLGNHSNVHFPFAAMDDGAAERELDESTRAFESSFGTCRSFAFPFGVPGRHYLPQHVAYLRQLGMQTLWSTEERPYAPSEADGDGVLPRVIFRGDLGGAGMALWASALALRFRLRRGRLAQASSVTTKPDVRTHAA